MVELFKSNAKAESLNSDGGFDKQPWCIICQKLWNVASFCSMGYLHWLDHVLGKFGNRFLCYLGNTDNERKPLNKLSTEESDINLATDFFNVLQQQWC